MEFLRVHQLDIMLILIGICGVLAVMTLMPKFVSPGRRSILTLMEAACMFLLIFDRLSYIHDGDPSINGGIIVRVSNGLVYFLILLITFLVTFFLRDVYRREGGLKTLPRRLMACEVLFVIGTVFVVVAQFNGLYYTFDAQNTYHRSAGFVFSYIIPLLIVIIQETVVIQYRDRLKSRLVIALSVSIALPTIASVVQIFNYGVSLTNMTMVIVIVVFFIYTLCALGAEAGNARAREIEFHKEARRNKEELFEETTEALANAIDAKDKYTHGHSTRVAFLSREIAKEAGLSDDECAQVYFAALLHDVGKIGIRDEVINKTGKLTDEEFEHIKTHTTQGSQILASIRHSPYLSVGAHYHHERYDGRGYPEGLAGEEIPVIARIIAVADAYDAMTSDRSYRNALSNEKVRDEIVKGIGKQFDKKYAEILLRLMEE